MAITHAIDDARDEQRKALARYHADYLAATAPLGISLLTGAVAGAVVYLVPVGVVLGSFVLLRLVWLAISGPTMLVMRLYGAASSGGAQGTPTPQAGSLPLNVPVPTGIESTLESSGSSWISAAGHIIFWPLALLAIGALLAWVYRSRRARRMQELNRTPLDFSIFPEVVLFYALTAAAGLVAGIGTFPALGANLIFAWAGYLIWRWLQDATLARFAPPAMRDAATGAAKREENLQHRLRESG